MRSWLAATVIFAAGTSVQAQMTAPTIPGVKPKSVTTVPIRPPALQTPADTANAMAQGERLALQSDLAWVGEYNGAITGDVSERMVAAIKEYQKNKGGKQTGVLNPQERAVLAETARRRQENVGWKIVTRCRYRRPARHSDQARAAADQRRQRHQMDLADRHHPGAADPAQGSGSDHGETRRPREEGSPGRTVDYTVVKPDFFVLSGLQGLKKFYLRGTFKGDEVRIMTILYDQAVENTVEPVVIAMSSAFNAFPTGTQGPAPRKTVEYSTGIVVTEDGAILADREATDGCQAVAIQGFGNVDRIAEDRDRGLALLHTYGARGLKPLGAGRRRGASRASTSSASPIRRTRAAARRSRASRRR